MGDVTLIVVFDGDCAFCSSCARFLSARVKPSVAVRPWQHLDIASLGLTSTDCSAALQCVDLARGETVSGHLAAARALRACSFPWSVIGRVIGWRVFSPLGAIVYRTVARNRHRLPGGTPECKVTPGR